MMADQADRPPGDGKSKPPRTAAQEVRLAEALRANLKRRKQRKKGHGSPSSSDTQA